jgi:transcription termination factor Rho
MSRKSIALFLATTGLITSLAGCGAGQDANENGGDDNKAGQPVQSTDGQRKNGDEGGKRDEGGEGGEGEKRDKRDQGDRKDEGGEGGEGGEG